MIETVPPSDENESMRQPSWFCVRTHAKHEHIASAQLRQIRGVEVFNPQLRVERVTHRGVLRSTQSLFANYIFARFDLKTNFERVRYTPSVKTVVHFGERAALIPDSVIEDLRMTLAANEGAIFTEAPSEGDEAEISVGPFQGQQGIVRRILPARQRVEVLLELMGRSIATEFNLSTIIFKRRAAASLVLSLS
jgi:transcription antitermination factor NusG